MSWDKETREEYFGRLGCLTLEKVIKEYKNSPHLTPSMVAKTDAVVRKAAYLGRDTAYIYRGLLFTFFPDRDPDSLLGVFSDYYIGQGFHCEYDSNLGFTVGGWTHNE